MRVRIEIGGRLDTPAPITVTAEATVLDLNRQARTSSTSFIVHPSEYYVGVKTEKSFVKPGAKLDIDLIVASVEGEVSGGIPVHVDIKKKVYETKRGERKTKLVAVKEDTIISAPEGATKYSFTSAEENAGGEYEVTVTVEDKKGRVNSSVKTFWVSGGSGFGTEEKTTISSENVMLIPDKDTYQPNEVAKVLVQPPFTPCNAVATLWAGNFVVWESNFEISKEAETHTIELPISDKNIPRAQLQVNIVGATPRIDSETKKPLDNMPPKPAYGSGALDIKVSLITKKLTVNLEPRDPLCKPGDETLVDVQVLDASGKPSENSEVTLFVVDDAVLSLTGYALVDPIGVFYTETFSSRHTRHNREDISIQDWASIQSIIESRTRQAEEEVMMRGQMMFARGGAPGGGMLSGAMFGAMNSTRERGVPQMKRMAAPCAAPMPSGADEPSIAVRTNFDSLAVFEAHLVTDSQGRCKLPFKLPDNLTSYRVWAVAVHSATHYGIGESSITAKLPLMMRPSLPRFLNFGDFSKLPVILQNQSPSTLQVKIAARASGASLSPGKTGYSLSLNAGQRAEILFETETSHTGNAQFQFVCVGKSGANSNGGFSDAVLVKLPVFTPATSEAFATYGELDGENSVAVQQVRAPTDVFPQFGSLDITMSSTAVGSLTDSFISLVTYPYECTEQRASRVMSIAALYDILAAFKSKDLPSSDEIKELLERDLEKISESQNHNGGFRFWSSQSDKEFPYMSVHVINAILYTKTKNMSNKWVEKMEHAAVDYLRNVEHRFTEEYSDAHKCTIRCYAANVLARYEGKPNHEVADKIIKDFGGVDSKNFSLESLGWLLPALSPTHEAIKAILRRIDNSVQESAETANLVSGYGDSSKLNYLLLFSNRRTDAVCLDSLIQVRPQDPLIAKLAKGLLAHRKRGSWGSTQENIFALLALSRYFATYEKDTPDFVTNAWFGTAHGGQVPFKGRSTDKHTISIPMKNIVSLQDQADASAKNLTIQKQGKGRLYYRLGLEYAPKNLDIKGLDRGFAVDRSYVGVDNITDAAWDAQNNEWRIKAGARVKVVLNVIITQRRYHVAFVDKLPGGLEALNPALAGTQSASEDGRVYGWYGRWYEHENFRDERVECFSSLVWEGAHQYSYYARATTPGTFIVPPAKAEEMYSPEVFGRCASTRVVIE
eukprot:TRINITY_DN1811_c1_g2_i1.p1 TRINITY_DN1811_c1_g2~~TRINITY_DN1811_c1_g2_i1.p1  ORF type:complete len:1198 (+),score=414.31 TRINITY_DN1811_c1_g2_i1:69-3596(+)